MTKVKWVNCGGGRGLFRVGTPVRCAYGTTARVQSSSVPGHAWLFVACDPAVLSRQAPGEAAMHLTPKQALALADRLRSWAKEASK